MLLCVFFGLTNQVCNYYEFLCKTYFVFENLKGECLKILILEKLGFKLVFWISFSSHTHTFYSLYSMLWGVFSKTRLFFLKCCFFLEFRLIQSVFWLIEIAFKIFVSLCLFRSIETCESGFLKIRFDLFKTFFQKPFKPLSLSPTWQGSTNIFFCRFPSNFLQGFSLPKPVCLYYPSFCIVFLIFMHYLIVFG